MNKRITVYPYLGGKPLVEQIFLDPSGEGEKDFMVLVKVQETCVRLIIRGSRIELAASRTNWKSGTEGRADAILAEWQPEVAVIGESEPEVPELSPNVKVVIEDVPE